MCVVEREREVLMAGAIRVSGLNGPMGSTSLSDARGRAVVCWVLTAILPSPWFRGPRILQSCQLECTPSGAILFDYSFGRYLKVEPRALLWGGLEIELNL